MSEPFPKRITQPFSHPFTIQKAGLYVITIVATCRSGTQMGQTGGEDLRVEIDGLQLREVPPIARIQQYNIPPTWNGSQLQGKSQTIIFIRQFSKGDHIIKFIPYRSAEILRIPDVQEITDAYNISFHPEAQAEDGERRPWYVLVLINLPLASLTVDATARFRWLDSDDIKLILNGTIKTNPSSLLRRHWLWAGSILKKLSQNERQQKTFTENLPQGNHYIELWADRMPILHKIEVGLGDIPPVIEKPPKTVDKPKRVPTVDDPEWTGNFDDDTEQMILARALFGEARGSWLSDNVRIGIGWSIRRRVEDTRWGNTYNLVITQQYQYSAFNVDDDNWPYVTNPLLVKKSSLNKKMWLRCYEIAGQVMRGEVSDPVSGANHYYDTSIELPDWATSEKFMLQIDTIRFYKL